jgi:hypothetical protein
VDVHLSQLRCCPQAAAALGLQPPGNACAGPLGGDASAVKQEEAATSAGSARPARAEGPVASAALAELREPGPADAGDAKLSEQAAGAVLLGLGSSGLLRPPPGSADGVPRSCEGPSGGPGEGEAAAVEAATDSCFGQDCLPRVLATQACDT